jgi:hypothetical protein
MSKWDINGVLAVMIILLSCVMIAGCVLLSALFDLGENVSLLIGGVITGFQTIVLLVVQFYFRKSKTEKEGGSK